MEFSSLEDALGPIAIELDFIADALGPIAIELVFLADALGPIAIELLPVAPSLFWLFATVELIDTYFVRRPSATAYS